MKKSYSNFLMAIVIVISIASTSMAENGNEKVRVIAHTDKEVSEAISHGCTIKQEAKNLKALECSKDYASSMGLKEDIELSAMDSVSNTQISASVVHSSGNLGNGRKVVVLDTGINYKHPELQSSYLGGKDFVNRDNDPKDDNGHGTHVAGIITANGISSRAKGAAPGTGIIAGKVLNRFGSGYLSDIVAGIYWAVEGPDGIINTPDDFKADAISISLGTSTTYKGFCDNDYPEFRDAIKYAVDNGVVVVVAAGNSNTGVSSPGCISYSTTIGAVDSKDSLASFSGRGEAVDLTAPGVGIYSTWLGTRYNTLSGTSMATPMVSATVALIKAAHPAYNVAQVQAALSNTAKDLGATNWDSNFGWGRVNASGAVNYLLP